MAQTKEDHKLYVRDRRTALKHARRDHVKRMPELITLLAIRDVYNTECANSLHILAAFRMSSENKLARQVSSAKRCDG